MDGQKKENDKNRNNNKTRASSLLFILVLVILFTLFRANAGIVSALIMFVISVIYTERNYSIIKLAFGLFTGTVLIILAEHISLGSNIESANFWVHFIDLNVFAFTISFTFSMVFFLFVSLSRILAEGGVMDTKKIRSVRDLITLCFRSKGFRLLSSLLLWLLAFGAVLAEAISLLPKIEMMGVYEFLIYLAVSFSSSILILIGVLFATRKITKSFFSVVKLIIVIVSFYISYALVLFILSAIAYRLI